MASIKPIESLSVHRIQSGQVIVDLCSVVKELLENSIDAGATSVEIRFKNQGLDAIEVSDNGCGISKEDYESVALKHYTSKLRSYGDLEQLETFGFRGEALSSLCAVSDVHIITAREDEAPKATRLNFTERGSLKDTSVVAGPKGTTVFVENIFKTLPVRRQELNRNIKREYTKVLNLLQAYACISAEARVIVSNVAAKGKKAIVFATKAKQSTRDNIANVFGTKTTASLIPLDLVFEIQPSAPNASASQVRVTGHVSMPTVGEGRQMADRQMFFVNGRPCALPQVAKVMNEVYKSYNLTQSPFIFANLELDTHAYDVNVSPDKRTIMLHDQGVLLDSLKASLLELFESHQQSVPQAKQAQSIRPSSFRQSEFSRATNNDHDIESQSTFTRLKTPGTSLHSTLPIGQGSPRKQLDLVQKLFTHKPGIQDTDASMAKDNGTDVRRDRLSPSEVMAQQISRNSTISDSQDGDKERSHGLSSRNSDDSEVGEESSIFLPEIPTPAPQLRIESEEAIPAAHTQAAKPSLGSVSNAFERMRPLRTPLQEATITIGDQTMTKIIGGPSSLRSSLTSKGTKSKVRTRVVPTRSGKPSFQSSLRAFAAPGTQMDMEESDDDEIEDEEESREEGRNESTDNLELQASASKRRRLDSSRESSLESDVDQAESISRQTEDGHDDDESSSGSDDEYIDDATKKARDEAKVQELIQEAEKAAKPPSSNNIQRADRILKGKKSVFTTQIELSISETTESILEKAQSYSSFIKEEGQKNASETGKKHDVEVSAEDRLSLTVSKEDFKAMHIAGQFNLGFIIACRSAEPSDRKKLSDELFIIDQHASDEKYNFERLQASTVVQNQKLVHHQRLDLTAVEEETVLENQDSLLKNGFEVQVDESGEYPVGKRCTLVSLPMSREVTFSTRDLEELIALLAESPISQMQMQPNISHTTPDRPSLARERSSFMTPVVRPSAVRKMFAMRACRSSVMVGKALSHKQMRGLVDNMGKMDKPWNCPHGRPTMRHLYSFSNWAGWNEGDGVRGMVDDELSRSSGFGIGEEVDWTGWLKGQEEEDGGEEFDGDGDEDDNDDEDDDQDEDDDEDEEGDEEDGDSEASMEDDEAPRTSQTADDDYDDDDDDGDGEEMDTDNG